jgi:hypothetical protein
MEILGNFLGTFFTVWLNCLEKLVKTTQQPPPPQAPQMLIASLSKRGFCQHRRQIAEGGHGLKTVFVSVCINLFTHMTKHKIFKFFASLHQRYMIQNACKMSSTNFRVTFVLTKTSLA